MKKTLLAAALLAALTLTGCAAVAPESTTAGSAETAPLVAPSETPEPTASADDEQYLAEVRLRLKNLPDATDEQLLTAAHEACDVHYPAGLTKWDMQFIEGEQPEVHGEGDTERKVYVDSFIIATWAAKIYCPEFDG